MQTHEMQRLCSVAHAGDLSNDLNFIKLNAVTGYDTIRKINVTCAQKLTKWPA